MFTYVLLYCLTTDVLKLNVKLGGAYRGGYGLPGLSPAGKYYRKSWTIFRKVDENKMDEECI